ncbi:MAG: HDOD domain-containing protein [Desulfobacula sp.]|uniref:HDOD domain-containing protein n=1 Tax=Desulfobacula sp. TaxID=2593537 RepID=UPI0025B92827|nr:HDOD domain-containing protein [Desulfobacula sp.]MCD4720846.1 HDOD domain-containing protein [Desulfobacula sp.]
MPTAKVLLTKFKELKTLPNIAIRLTRMISDDAYSMQEFEEIINLDPTLVLKILQIVNSPYYSLLCKVTHIAEAVSFIGMNNLRNLIVMDIVKNIIKNSNDYDVFSRNKLWLHSAAVGICSQLIAEKIFEQNGENAFLCGLIHDIGMIIEDQLEPQLFMKVCKAYKPGEDSIIEVEKKIIGTDHSRVGFYLAQDWKLPLTIQEGIGQHHLNLKKIDPESIPGIIQIADYLIYRQNISPIKGLQGRILSQPLLTHMRDNIQEYKAIMLDLPQELSKAEAIYSLDKD